MTKISVCIATHNGERFIYEQIESILAQLTHDDELIISDDKSSDSTLSIIRGIEDPRIKIFTNYKKKGYVNNFLNALNKASGDYIYLSDQDDIWLPTKIKETMPYFSLYDIVIHDSIVVDENVAILYDSYFDFRNTKKGFFNNLLSFGYLGCQVAFTKTAFEKALPFPKRTDLVTHDAWFCLFGEFFLKVKVLSKPLMLYRRHDSNVSAGGKKIIDNLWHKLSIRLYILLTLINRFLVFRIFK